MILAAATEPNRGWGGPLALLVAFAIFRIVVMPAGRWAIDKIQNPSPPPPPLTAKRAKAQLTADAADDDDPEEPEIGWWGRIVEVGGVRVRQAQQVWRTGSHELPSDDDLDDEDPADDEDPEIDLELDEPEDLTGETAEQFIARARDLQVPYAHVVRVVADYYEMSAEDAKELIREMDAERRP